MSDEARYHFGPLERRGVLLGWRGGQILTLVVGLTVAMASLRAAGGAAGAAGAVGAVALAGAVAFWPVAGRTGEEWLPTIARWVLDRAMGASRADPRRLGSAFEVHRVPARPLRGPRRTDGEEVGVVHDRWSRTVTGVVGVDSQDFALLSGAEKEQRVTAWSAALAALAREGSMVHRLQWLATSTPDDARQLWSYFGAEAVLGSADAARRSYADLLGGFATRLVARRTWLSVQLRLTGRAARAQRAAGGGLDGASAVLLRELGAVERALAGAHLAPTGALSPRELGRLVTSSWSARPVSPDHTMAELWPPTAEVHWDHLRTANTWHASYWIAEWPRTDVGPEFLAPLLLGDLRTTVSMVMEPIDPLRALRLAQRARTADVADAELRRRGGFLGSARRARESEGVRRREAELADGHGSYRFAGFVRVTVTSGAELEGACEATEQAAAQCGLELRRLAGEQERGLLATLPLAVGLR